MMKMADNMMITRDDTKIMKGIAIILMLTHHLWSFPDRMAGGSLNYSFSIFGMSSIVYFGLFGKICVSLFFFLGGYGIYKSSQGKSYDIIRKLKKLYLEYWKVFLIFIPIAFVFFSHQTAYCDNATIWNRFGQFTWTEFINNFLGMSTSFNGEWWFLGAYVFAVITFPLIRKVFDKHSAAVNIALVIAGEIIFANVCPAIGGIQELGNLNTNVLYQRFILSGVPYISCFWMGIAAAKDNLLIRIRQSMEKEHLLNPFIDILIWGAVIFLRGDCLGQSFDFVYIPFLIISSLDIVYRTSFVRKGLLCLGRQSTNMWLIHSFLCYYFYPAVLVITCTRWAIPSLLLLIVFSYLLSLCVDYFWKGIRFVSNQIILVLKH